MSEHGRASDEMIAEMIEQVKIMVPLVSEIHQRQTEFTVPGLRENKDEIAKLRDAVNNLLTEHSACQQRVCALEKRVDGFQKMVWSIVGGVTAVVACVIGVFEFVWRHK